MFKAKRLLTVFAALAIAATSFVTLAVPKQAAAAQEFSMEWCLAPSHRPQRSIRPWENKGECTSTLQYWLKYMADSPNIAVDGVIGVGSDAAIKKFQKAVKIGQDGIVGLRTWEAITWICHVRPSPTTIYFCTTSPTAGA